MTRLQSGPFAEWFIEQVKEIHGLDLAELPQRQPSDMVVDSGVNHPPAQASP